MINKITFLLAFGLVAMFSNGAYAQANPVTLWCLKNDTLRWSYSSEGNCGNFSTCQIYYSENMAGPYTLLASISDGNTTSYYHENANSANNIWYYYMTASYDCPQGVETSVASDTLDNRDPDFPTITMVGVQNSNPSNSAVIKWEHSKAPETVAYIIYRKNENNSFDAIDTVSASQTSYIDVEANPNEKSEEYTVMALDACGNTSIFNTKSHATILLNVELDSCTHSATLNWNHYKDWNDQVNNYNISVVEFSLDSTLLSYKNYSTPSSDSTYTLHNLENNRLYIFAVSAVLDSVSTTPPDYARSPSNIVVIQTNFVQPSEDLTLMSASYTTDNDIQLIWAWDTVADMTQASILHSSNNMNYTEAQSLTLPSPLPYLDTMTISHPNLDATTQQYFKIATNNQCDSITTSNYAATIYLSGNVDETNTNHTLSWSPMIVKNANITSYRLFKTTANGDEFLSELKGDIRSFDEILTDENRNLSACYYVIGYGNITLPSGQLYGITSRSNTYCTQSQSSIVFPNAFAPNGKNPIFKPRVIAPENINDYQLLIFNRWGKLVFKSQDIEQGWTGDKASSGNYVYTMKATYTDGRKEEQQGTLILLR